MRPNSAPDKPRRIERTNASLSGWRTCCSGCVVADPAPSLDAQAGWGAPLHPMQVRPGQMETDDFQLTQEELARFQ